MRRAARFNGFFPINIESAEQVADVTGVLHTLREHASPAEPFDVIVTCPRADAPAYAGAGATWWLTDFETEALTLRHGRAVTAKGPAF